MNIKPEYNTVETTIDEFTPRNGNIRLCQNTGHMATCYNVPAAMVVGLDISRGAPRGASVLLSFVEDRPVAGRLLPCDS